VSDWRGQYKLGDLVEVRHTHVVGGENEWSRIRVLSAGEDRWGSFVELDMNGLGFRVYAAEDIRMPCGPLEGETVYDGYTQKKIRKVTTP
jgi:hypothetical protein